MLFKIVIILGLISSAGATCEGNPFVMQDVGDCFTIITNTTSPAPSNCVTSDERSRRQSLIDLAQECLNDVYTLNECEGSFTATYQSYLSFASFQASIYRCADDCRNDTNLTGRLQECYTASFSQDHETLDCDSRSNLTGAYDSCIVDILQPSGCARNFTNEWFEISFNSWDAIELLCVQETSCYDTGEIFSKGTACRQATVNIELVGFELGEYCKSSLGTLKPCIEDILTNYTCEEEFNESFRETAYSDIEEYCTDQRICDHQVMQCLNSDIFTFSVDTSDYDTTCRNLHDALDTGDSCLGLHYDCSPSHELIHNLEKSLAYHRDLYQHMCLAGNNCIFDQMLMQEIDLCYKTPISSEGYCETFEEYLGELRHCYAGILQEGSCSKESEDYYNGLYKQTSNMMETKCNARCTNTNAVMGEIQVCHETLATEVKLLTSDISFITQKDEFCSSLQTDSNSLTSCVSDLFDLEWCDEEVISEELAYVSVYTQIQQILCDSDHHFMELGLQCDSFEPVFDALFGCSRNIYSKIGLIQSRLFDVSETVCQDTKSLQSDAMQCLSSKLFSLHCPIELPASMVELLHNHTEHIKEYCRDIPVVASGSLIVASTTLTMITAVLSFRIIQ